MSQAWPRLVHLHELARGPVSLRLEPDAAERAKIAHDLGLETLPSLVAEVTLRSWLDGVEIAGRFRARVEQICSVSLDPFEQPVEGRFELRAVPAGSPHAPAEQSGELDYDPEAPDPPDVLADEAVDVSAYVVEHLALEIDPFPRKPGAEFEYAAPDDEASPFAILKRLSEEKD